MYMQSVVRRFGNLAVHTSKPRWQYTDLMQVTVMPHVTHMRQAHLDLGAPTRQHARRTPYCTVVLVVFLFAVWALGLSLFLLKAACPQCVLGVHHTQ